MMKWTWCLLVVGALFLSTADVSWADPPAQLLVRGVPFVSIAEANALDAWVTAWTPSARAAHMMVLRYYRPEAKTAEDYMKATDEQEGPLQEEWEDAKGLDEVRALLSAGKPVIVVTAITPYAHELYSMFEMLLASGAQMGVNLRELDSRDYSSRILGHMVGLDAQRKIGKAIPMNPLHELAIRCERVVVGVDPARRVVIVHDASFGPSWEVPYDDFEVMWSAADHMYCVLAPKDGAQSPVTASSAYPARTPDQQAAEHFLYGYSLAATGKAAEAGERYRAGLSLEGLSRGYRFLFLQERSFLAYRQGKWEEAVSLLRQATEEIPQAPGPWVRMAQICRDTGVAGGKTAGDEFQKKADELAADEAGMEAGAKAFPENLPSPVPLIRMIPGPPPE
jgi:tetratricopeptide (TPR) repeat protein